MMNKLIWLLVPLFAIACSRKQAESTMKPNAAFENTRWKITAITGVDALPADTRKEMFIRFYEGRFSGNAGCNQLMGGYSLQGNTLKLTNAASTMMACPPPLMESEQKFTEALGKVDNYLVKGDHLQLRQGETVLAEFDAVYLK